MKQNTVEVSEGEEKEKGVERIFEQIMAENFPNLMQVVNINIEEAQQTLKMNSKRHTPRHILIKLSKARGKERILKAAREKQIITYKGSSIRL